MAIGKKKILQQKRLFRLTVFCCFLFLLLFKSFQVNGKSLPSSQIHPLPAFLAQWQDFNNQGNYFHLIQKTPVDYLVWSQFPIKIYVEKALEQTNNSAQEVRSQEWVNAVKNAIKEWNKYLPLKEIAQPELADINIIRLPIEREFKLNPETGLYDIPRAITAQTNYRFYIQAKTKKLLHKMTIKISPDLGKTATIGAARHELGHALGIWGHSDRESDALYFSQVRNTPNISDRDINTLQKIYQQPTKLGWKIKN